MEDINYHAVSISNKSKTLRITEMYFTLIIKQFIRTILYIRNQTENTPGEDMEVMEMNKYVRLETRRKMKQWKKVCKLVSDCKDLFQILKAGSSEYCTLLFGFGSTVNSIRESHVLKIWIPQDDDELCPLNTVRERFVLQRVLQPLVSDSFDRFLPLTKLHLVVPTDNEDFAQEMVDSGLFTLRTNFRMKAKNLTIHCIEIGTESTPFSEDETKNLLKHCIGNKNQREKSNLFWLVSKTKIAGF